MNAETPDPHVAEPPTRTDRRAAARYRAALESERRSAALYRGLAAGATGERQRIFLELSAVEERHARHWADKLSALGEHVPAPGRAGPRTRLLSWLARRFSVDAVLPMVERAEHADAGLYANDPDAAPGMAVDERSHARVLTWLREQGSAAGAEGGRQIVRRERWHRSDRSGALRAAVFGVNDGLVSNTALVMGFAGSGAAGSTILFAGVAGLLAGAFSMAAGEYVSMRSQREAYEREIALEADELRDDPEAEAEELALIYRAKGLDAEEAERVATTIMKDDEAALNTMAREELGLDPDELGSPLSAALSSLVAFALGALVVVLPYLFGSGPAALVAAVVLAVGALFTVGAVLGLLNGRAAVRSGARQLLVGAGAAAAVFGIGHAIGTGSV
ncbi:VIT1/CCC1 transporter family protein [Streptomyces silvisoli]|uniref:VIT1/CCC1 transporter family protein n=1 Tax=Streptomyces silvisoli TaxID=3034235 RepID=A0ABT5ZFM7_9ACTN|nr:VIT1/CCC1 transporter family protein [Streptomyces silvisoli]MDF3288627.1 VIT1/CCC1 transporter family protein [Streptomyces silvisoli]